MIKFIKRLFCKHEYEIAHKDCMYKAYNREKNETRFVLILTCEKCGRCEGHSIKDLI
jgi:RNase P subunit RPR2